MKNLGTIAIIIALIIGAYIALTSFTPAEAPVEQEESQVQTFTLARQEMVAYHGEVEGYIAVPEGEGPFPALVLIHEWWGLNDNIKSLADDFAEQGYVALAVDLYEGELADTPEQAGALAGGVRENVEPAFANLEAATEYLASLEKVDGEKLASVGWCFGGQWAYNMAVNNMNVDASVMYYGRFMPEDDLSMMRADILGHFGEEDTLIAVDDVRQFEAKLQTLEGDHAVFIYPNAGHAFANEDNEEAYNEEAAQIAWERTLEFLAREVE
jgi:carboxymethylenebutenolidase